MTGPVQDRRFVLTDQNRTRREAAPESGDLDLGRIMLAVRRQLRLIALCCLAGVVLSAVVILGTAPRYNAVETVLLNEQRADLLDEVSPLPNVFRSDSAVQSEIEILKSQDMAYRVVDRLGLHEDPDFLAPPVDLTQRVTRWIRSLGDPLIALLSPPPPEPVQTDAADAPVDDGLPRVAVRPDARDRAAGLLRDRLSVSRIGRSFVIQIGFEDFDPVRAATIARVYGSSYERFQLDANQTVAGNAADWLQDRLAVLDRQSLEAASAVQEFRAANDLTQVRGSLLTEQQQSELATELVSAAAQSAERRAQLDSMESLLARSEQSDAVITVPGAEGSAQELTTELRREYQTVRLRHGSLSDQFGPDHPQVTELQRRMDDLRDLLRAELAQATEAARIAFNAARSREESLRRDLEAATSMSAENVAVRGRLQQLESISDTYEEVYRQYLSRYQVAVQQQGFPIASVNVISRAEVPTGASSPRKKAMLMAGGMLGVFIGVMIAALRELRPRPVRTASRLTRDVGIACAGLLPQGGLAGEQRARARTLDRVAQACEAYGPGASGLVVGIASLSEPTDDGDGLITDLAGRFAHGDRRRVLVLDAGAANDADALAGLNDAGALSGAATGGVSHASMQSVRADHAAAGDGDDLPRDDWTLIGALRDRFDVVLWAIPLLGQTARTDAQVRACDLVVLHIPWGKVSPAFVSDALRDNPWIEAKLATSVLDGADLREARRYMAKGSYEERETHA